MLRPHASVFPRNLKIVKSPTQNIVVQHVSGGSRGEGSRELVAPVSDMLKVFAIWPQVHTSPPKRLCSTRRLFVCLCICLLASASRTVCWSDLSEQFSRERMHIWMRKNWLRFKVHPDLGIFKGFFAAAR